MSEQEAHIRERILTTISPQELMELTQALLNLKNAETASA